MTKKELEAIEAREQAASPGPWEARIWNINWEITYYVSMPNDILKVSCYTLEDHEREDENYRYVNDNAEFIAHARQDIPALIAENKRLNAELERMTMEYDSAVADVETLLGEIDNCLVCGPSPSGNVRKIRKKTV